MNLRSSWRIGNAANRPVKLVSIGENRASFRYDQKNNSLMTTLIVLIVWAVDWYQKL
jgi:hypothetical protein